jgi:hypothetical protein
MNIEELLKSNEDLEKYFEENKSDKDYLVNYYLQDPNRIQLSFDKYSIYIPTIDKIELIKKLIEKNVNESIIGNAIYCTNLYSEKQDEEIIKEFFLYLIELDKNKQINLDNFDIVVKSNISRIDPLYFLRKDPKNVSYFTTLENEEAVFEVLKYLKDSNYTFTKTNEYFLKDNVLNNTKTTAYFINNCIYDDELKISLVVDIFKGKTKEDLHELYCEIDEDYFKKKIRKITNINNFDLSTIAKDSKLFIEYDGFNLNEIKELLKIAKEEELDIEIVIAMDRVDMNLCDELHSLYGDKLRIAPKENQNKSDNDVYNYEDYSYEHIKKCEYKIDSFVECTNDKVDKDGDIKSLSPLEKFVAAYIITTMFATYQEADLGENDGKSRSIYEVFGYDEKPKIVCVGFVRTLKELLYRMDIKDTAEWAIFSPEEAKRIKAVYTKGSINHDRLLIHLQDPKYNIDGVYMSEPTWDNRHRSYRHILMSKDELLEKDPSLNHEYLRTKEVDKCSDKLNCEKPSLIFDRKIPEETLIKAFMAVNRFLNKNQKMAKDDSEYTKIEYDEVAKQLGFLEEPTFDKRNIEEMTGEELSYVNDVYYLTLATSVRSLFSEYLEENGIDLNVKLVRAGAFIPLDETLPLEQLVENGFVVDLENKRLYLNSYEFNKSFKDKKIIEYFKHALDRVRQYQGIVNSLSNENEVKTK